MEPSPMSWPDRIFGFVALALFVSMSAVLIHLNPGQWFRFILGLALVGLGLVGGFLVLVWLWDHRNPARHRQVERLVRATQQAAGVHVRILSASWRGGYGARPAGCVRLTVARDAEIETLRGDAFQATFSRLIREHGLEPNAARVALVVDSQETVDRDFDGDWWAYDK